MKSERGHIRRLSLQILFAGLLVFSAVGWTATVWPAQAPEPFRSDGVLLSGRVYYPAVREELARAEESVEETNIVAALRTDNPYRHIGYILYLLKKDHG